MSERSADIAVIGVGATGSNVLRTLLESTSSPLHVFDTDRSAVSRGVAAAPHGRVRGHSTLESALDAASVVVLATPTGAHGSMASAAIDRRSSVVSLTDSLDDVRDLFALDELARERGVAVVAGAGMAPGLTCVLARHAGDALDEVQEIAVSKAGTGGPACARQHHRAMKQTAWDWLDGVWFERRGGSGRDLVWFPPPIGARDAYKAALPSPLLLQRTYPSASRLVARVTATRRDRFTSRLPMLRPPHADGGPGAVRVEVRGRVDGRFETIVYACAAAPSYAAGVMGAVTAGDIADPSGSLAGHVGAYGLSERSDPATLLHRCRSFGLAIMTFEGTAGM